MITFDSWSYIGFVIVLLLIYWRLSKKWQNWLLLLASLLFYATWDWRFLGLIFISTGVDYYAALRIALAKTASVRRNYLIFSIVVNLIILGFFKYFNFFIDSANRFLDVLGLQTSFSTLNIILPIGISFYTFKAISYVVEVYKKDLNPTGSFSDYLLLVSFFPALISGPIDLAKNMLRQINVPRKFSGSQFWKGVDLILWGLLKKVVISNNLIYYITIIFNSQKEPSTLLAVLGAIMFGVSLLADFSGYTDIARGSAKLFGFELCENFNFPYIAQNFSDFWRRWHISLSSFFRDYVYIPLGGSRCSKLKYLRNIFVTWILTGLWHGAAWHFIFWGLYHGFFTVISRFIPITPIVTTSLELSLISKISEWLKIGLSVAITFLLVNIGWLLFIVSDTKTFLSYFSSEAIIMSFNDGKITLILLLVLIFYSLPLIVNLVWCLWKSKMAVHEETRNSLRILFYTLALLILLVFGGVSHDFIYFQF